MAYSRPCRTTKPFWGVEELKGADALKPGPENPAALTVLGWLSLQRQDPKEA